MISQRDQWGSPEARLISKVATAAHLFCISRLASLIDQATAVVAAPLLSISWADVDIACTRIAPRGTGAQVSSSMVKTAFALAFALPRATALVRAQLQPVISPY